MKMTIDAGIMPDMFRSWDRDYYTYEACEALIEWYDEIDPDTEFDVIGVCCDWNEYGNTPCLTWDSFLSEYGYLLEETEIDDDASDEEKREALIDVLEDKTTVLRLSDSVLVAAF